MASRNFWNPCIDSSDDESAGKSKMKCKVMLKKTKTNADAIKNPEDIVSDQGESTEEDVKPSSNRRSKRIASEDDEDEAEVIEDDDVISSSPTSPRKRKKTSRPTKENVKRKKKKGQSESDDDFDPGSDSMGSASEEDEEEEDDAQTDDNISDSDFMPDSDDERQATKDSSESNGKGKGAAPNPEFWSKVEELKNKGFSIQQAGAPDPRNNGPAIVSPVATSPVKVVGRGNHGKLAAFTQLYINFEHEKRCMKKCFMMEPKQKATWAEIDVGSLVTPDFVKACIRVVMCCMRLGDCMLAREAIELLNKLANINGISALCQAMISGVKAQNQTLDEIERLEESGMEALRNREFTSALETIDQALNHASGCVRLKMARGDCLAHLGRYVDGAKAASSILQQDQRHVGALFLRGFCLYHKNNVERALTHFQQVLQQSKGHERAQTLLFKSKQFKEKKEAAVKATNEARLEDAERIYSEAITIDPRNKGTNANLLADRAEVYFMMKRIDDCIKDCEASLALDQGCLAAMLQRARCHMETKEWEAAVRIFERMNNRDRHNQQSKKKAGEAALKAGNHEEAHRLFSEACDVDKHNKKYRHLLREAKQEHLKATRIDFYALLGLEKTAGDSEIKKAYFKKSKEFHPDRHANAEEAEKEEFSAKFKQAKEAYETLKDPEKRKVYDTGAVKPPPGGWYRDIDRRIFQNVQARGGVRGRGVVRGGRGAPIMRGAINIRGAPMAARGVPVRGGRVMRGQPRPMAPGRGTPIRVANVRGGVTVRGGPTILRGGATINRGGAPRMPINVRPGNPTMRPTGSRKLRSDSKSQESEL